MLRKWFVMHHGEGESHQYDLYRCDQCRGLVTHRMIRETAGCACPQSKLRPTNPTFIEAVKLMVTPWLVK